MTTQDTSLRSSSDAAPKFTRPDPVLPERHVFVVADRFAQFADGEQVLTISDLLLRVSSGAAATSGCTLVVHVGQGIEASDWQLLESSAGASRAAVVRTSARGSLLGSRLEPETVHKIRPENVLLASVRNLAKGRCTADLRIHRDNELVIDHRTGQHVQGMVIIEAMRQICIAQFETDYRTGLPACEYTGMWQRINLSFQDFLFALPATVVSEMATADLSRPTNLSFRAKTSVWQNGVEVASAEIDYAMIKQERFATLERRKAARTTQACLARLADQRDAG